MTKDPMPRATKPVPSDAFQDWALRALGVTASDHGIDGLDGTGVQEAMTLLSGLKLLSQHGYSKTRPAGELPVGKLAGDGLEVFLRGGMDGVISRVFDQYLSNHGSRCPIAPADALGWFGDLLIAHARSDSSPLMKAIMASLTRTLGYPVTDPATSGYVCLNRISRISGVPVEGLLQAVPSIDTNGRCLRLDSQNFVVPIDMVVSLRQAVGEWN